MGGVGTLAMTEDKRRPHVCLFYPMACNRFHSKFFLARKSVHGVYRHPVTWSQKLDNIHACFQLLNSQGIRTTGISPEGKCI